MPTHYARAPVAPYGTRGRRTAFRSTRAFHEKLERAFSELWEICPLGEADIIVSAGAYVPKGGYHGQGRAFDLDAIFWPTRSFIAAKFPVDPRFYLAIEAVLRRTFGSVLAYSYNAAHRDHLHVQGSRPPALNRGSRGDVLFLQNVATYLFGRGVRIDGIWGPETRGATVGVAGEIGITRGLDYGDAWQAFLRGVAERGFDGAAPRDEPYGADSDRLVAVYRAIDAEGLDVDVADRLKAAVRGAFACERAA